MSTFIHKVLSATAPVFSVTGSIALLRAADHPFPIPLAATALPEWVIFFALVYTGTAILLFIVNQMFGPKQPKDSPRLKSAA